jgi:hypothetical protein
MTTRPTRAERLDRAVDELLLGAPAGVAAASVGLAADERPLLEAAASLRATLAPSLVGARFESRLGARLSATHPPSRPLPPPPPPRYAELGLDLARAAASVRACRMWHARGQGFNPSSSGTLLRRSPQGGHSPVRPPSKLSPVRSRETGYPARSGLATIDAHVKEAPVSCAPS